MDGFSLFRSDRTKDSGKRMEVACFCLWMRSGVMEITCQWNTRYATERWAVDCQCETVLRTTRAFTCSHHYRLCATSANAKDAANAISIHVLDLDTSAPDAFKLLLAISITVHLKHQSWAVCNMWNMLLGKIVHLTSATRMLKMPIPLCLSLFLGRLHALCQYWNDLWYHPWTIFAL